MKFPLFGFMTKSMSIRAAGLLALMASLALTAMAQKKSVSLAPEAESATLQQCRNGNPGDDTPGGIPDCRDTGGGATGWVTGNAGASNSHWKERDFIAYRMLFDGLTIGAVDYVTIGYDVLDNGKHAIDYLGTYNYTETNADACSGVLAPCPSPNTAPIPTDPDIPVSIPQIPGDFTLFGGTFDIDPMTAGNQFDITRVPCPTNDDIRQCIRIGFIPSIVNPVMAWGGHIAWRGEWGIGQSAGGISGSPYHMRLIDLNGSGGNQDRSLSAQGVVGPGSLRIIKEVITNPVGTSSTVQFFFNANRAFTPLNFFLVDDDAGAGVDFKLSDSILTYDGTANVITVTEDMSQFPVNQNWSLGGITCVESVSTTGTTISVPFATATVTVDPEEVVTCTFRNQQLTPSAAQVAVSGRTLDSFGNGIGGARIVITNAANGSTWSAMTNSFGYYTIEGLDVGEFYVVTASHKRFTFADDTRTISVNDSVTGMDFVANP